jgi:hypothetical protein
MYSPFAYSHLQPYHSYEYVKRNLRTIRAAAATWSITDHLIHYAYEEIENVKCIYSLLISILHVVNKYPIEDIWTVLRR